MMNAQAMSPAFLDWWFAPWRYAGGKNLPYCDGMLAQRDAYRAWCLAASVRADLPDAGDIGWHAAALSDAGELQHSAELFGGLFAARRHSQQELKLLPPEQRRWCMSVALTQPLQAWANELPEAERTPRNRGLLELALRLERAFPGMWSRLRLLLPETQVSLLERMLSDVRPDEKKMLREREWRCWEICLARAKRT